MTDSCLLVSSAHSSCESSGPHPALRRLVAFDAAASLAVLQGGLVGWDALDSDLLDAAAACAEAPSGAATARSATQASTAAWQWGSIEAVCRMLHVWPHVDLTLLDLHDTLVSEHAGSNRCSGCAVVSGRLQPGEGG